MNHIHPHTTIYLRVRTSIRVHSPSYPIQQSGSENNRRCDALA